MAIQMGESPLTLPFKSASSLYLVLRQPSAIAHLAHDENLTEIATRLEVFLSGNWQELAAGKDWLNLEQLLEWWTLSPTASDESQA